MEKLQRALILVPVITAVMQGIKQLLPTRLVRFMRIITSIIGVLCAYGYVWALEIATMNNAMIIFWGIIAGLSASGLYEVINNTKKVLMPTEELE